MLAGEGPLLVPGAYDGASARAVYGQGHAAELEQFWHRHGALL